MSLAANGLTRASGTASASVTAVNGAVQVAPHQAYGIFFTGTGADSAAADAIRDTLLAAGWTLAATLQAVGSLNAPFGWGYTAPAGDNTPVVITYPTAFGVSTGIFVFYDPTTQLAPTGPDVIPVIVGSNSVASQLKLLAAINGFGGVTAVTAGPYAIVVTADAAGTLGNLVTVTGNGSNSTGGNPTGGGWVLQSRSQQQATRAGNTASVIASIYPGGGGRLEIDLNIGGTINLPSIGGAGGNPVVGGSTIEWPTEAGAWQMIADDFGAIFWSLTPFHGGDIRVANNFLWGTTLYIPASIPLDYAAFVMTTDQDAQATPTLGANNNMVVYCFAAGTNATVNPGQQGWSIGMYHSEGGAIADPTGAALLQVPYVFMPCGYNAESRICGQLWDTVASSQPEMFGQQFTIQGAAYRAIAAQSNPPGTLLMLSGETTNTGATGSASNPPAPTPTKPAPPASAVGLGNVAINSPYFGSLASLSATQPFSSLLLGTPIIIGGVTYNVAYYTSPAFILFSPAPPAAALNVPYSFAA